MDPGRRAMIESGRSGGSYPPDRRRDITSPRRDPNTRISKPPARYAPQRPQRPQRPPPSSSELPSSAVASTYQTQDEQSLQFVADEDKFVLRQSKKKADIRVREGRATAIDNLAFYVRWLDPGRGGIDDDDDGDDALIDVPAPEAVVGSLDAGALEALDREIVSFHTLETDEHNREYWTALRALCRERRRALRGRGADGGRAVGSVADDVDRILGPKTLEQLETLERQIRTKLDSDADIDVDYWDQLLKSLLVRKAKARLRKIGEAVRDARAAVLRKNNHPDLAEALEKGLMVAAPPQPSSSSTRPIKKAPPALAPAPGFPSGTPSSSSTAPPPGTERFARTGDGDGDDFSQATKALYDREVARGISENEEIFAGEEAVPGAAAAPRPPWADKHRPRKPRYFNRVQMGYDWNKYNQTHYDHDNPPPRVVHGYKFNIFYPDLIDKTRAPTFKIIREGGRRRGELHAPAGQQDTCLIRFTAGPPYEDIAFRIVDREWDYSAKRERGFRSSFDKGILQLHFQFKRIFYRK